MSESCLMCDVDPVWFKIKNTVFIKFRLSDSVFKMHMASSKNQIRLPDEWKCTWLRFNKVIHHPITELQQRQQTSYFWLLRLCWLIYDLKRWFFVFLLQNQSSIALLILPSKCIDNQCANQTLIPFFAFWPPLLCLHADFVVIFVELIFEKGCCDITI